MWFGRRLFRLRPCPGRLRHRRADSMQSTPRPCVSSTTEVSAVWCCPTTHLRASRPPTGALCLAFRGATGANRSRTSEIGLNWSGRWQLDLDSNKLREPVETPTDGSYPVQVKRRVGFRDLRTRRGGSGLGLALSPPVWMRHTANWQNRQDQLVEWGPFLAPFEEIPVQY